ncbi:methyltransferase [Kibdelosporangium aridum]|uniref:Dimerisation domain-containing protein n=1 Tax=Kibdelosporangium aridum TaxID=2030 RepID=A0A1W2FWN8_KIBAR|nr:methyltransferase [Kibdelosporangium aridum]SMD26369.1 Dimerisation domain-containing protein [Kibdelosporangium aridum]
MTDAADTMLHLLTGGWVAQTLRALAELNIPDHLADGPVTAEDVAERVGSDPRATYRLMRAASSLGVLSYEGEHRFGLTELGTLLRSDTPGSMRSLVMIQNERAHWQSWGLFPEAVRQGRSQSVQALGAGLFDYFARPENAAEAALFARAMGDLSRLVTHGAVAAVDSSDVSTVVDVGGADGDFVLGLMAANSGMKGVVLELPHAIDGARHEAERRGLADRFTAVAGDFFVAVPSADLYLLKMIMHDWPDEQCVTILRNCRAAVQDGGRALVVEMVIGEIGKPDFATRVDMNMLAVTQGMERDLDEYDALFAASGWRRTKTYPVGGGYSLMELTAE